MLLLWVTTALASSACSEPWWTAPALHDQNPHYLERHRELTWQASSGRTASPAYREPWARMDVDLWLRANGQEGLYLGDQELLRMRDLSLTAATLAGQLLLDEVVQTNDTLRGLQLALRTVTNPSLTISHGVQVNQVSRSANLRDERAMLEPGLRVPPKPRLTVGSTGKLVDDPLDPSASVAWAYTAFVAGQRLGLDSFRVGVDVVQLSLGVDGGPELPMAWNLTVRHGAAPRWWLVGEARSIDASLDPRYLRSGLEYKPLQRRRVYIRATATYGFETLERDSELRADLRVTWTPRWRTPARQHPGPWTTPTSWLPPTPHEGPSPLACGPGESEDLPLVLSPGP